MHEHIKMDFLFLQWVIEGKHPRKGVFICSTACQKYPFDVAPG